MIGEELSNLILQRIEKFGFQKQFLVEVDYEEEASTNPNVYK